MAHVVIWPHARTPGWAGGNDAPRLPIVPLLDALTTHHATDAHAGGVIVQGEVEQPRLKKAARRALRDMGATARLEVVFADLDRPNHAPWEAPQQAHAAVQLAATLAPGAAVYGTRAGLRLVWTPADPPPLAQAKAWLRAWHEHCRTLLAPLTHAGLHLDDSAPQWTRGFRLPRVVRDGVALDPPMALEGLAPLVWSPPAPEDEGIVPLTVVDHRRVDLPEVVWTTLQGALPDLDLRGGAPYAQPGNRNTALTQGMGRTVRALADLAPDAPTLAQWAVSAWWDSLAAVAGDGAPTVHDAWRLAEEFAGNDHPGAPAPQATPTPEDGPAIVMAGPRYHVLDTASPELGYGPGVPGVALPGEVRRRAPNVPWSSARGVPFPPARLMAHHGAVAHAVTAHYHRTVTTFDGTTLHMGVCPRVAIEPRHHPQVARWLVELSGGPFGQGDLLLDWLATVTLLDRATAALYIRGEPDAGKTLFARGVAALWAAAPVSFAEIAGRWNGGLLECPVVHLSEGHQDRHASAAFRRLTGDRVHRVERKYEALVSLVGHPRVVVGANNDDALPLDTHHTRDDLEAIARRVLYMRTTGRCAEVLQGVDHTRWTDPDGPLPQHIAWLVATRQEAALTRADARFLVRGVESPWHRSLLLRSGGNEGVLSAVAVALGDGRAALVQRGRVWVNVSALHRTYRLLTGEEHTPTRAAIARTVRDLSPADSSTVLRHKGEQIRVWEIPADLVLRVAENHGLPCAEDLRRVFALNGPVGVGGAGVSASTTAPAQGPSVGNNYEEEVP